MQEAICNYLVQVAMPKINNITANGAPCAELSSLAFYLGEFYVQMRQTINTAEMLDAVDFITVRLDECIVSCRNNQATQLMQAIAKAMTNFRKEMITIGQQQELYSD